MDVGVKICRRSVQLTTSPILNTRISFLSYFISNPGLSPAILYFRYLYPLLVNPYFKFSFPLFLFSDVGIRPYS